MTVLIHMMPDQERYFTEEVVSEFEKNNPVKLKVVHYTNLDSIEPAMRAQQEPVSLVKVPFDKRMPLMRKGVFKPLDKFLSKETIEKFDRDYLLTSVGSVDGRLCLIPRKFETRIMVYCKSKVADAYETWRNNKETIDSLMSLYNGYGLPATYLLEENPEEWDYFDVFVVGWIWAHTLYNGKVQARIAHRGKMYSGTSQRLFDRIYQLGGDSMSLVTIQGDAVTDAVFWEAVYTSAGIYNGRMWREGWSGGDIWKAFASEDVFLSFMTQLDCFFLHGTGRDNLDGYLKYPDDMGIATIPKACSVQCDATGIPKYGSKAITTGGWWWGIPSNAPDPELSFKLATFITGTTTQIQECSRFGMIPVRKDILSDMSMMFGGGWVSDIYDVSFRQLVHNGYTVLPGNRNFTEISSLYLAMINDIVVAKNWAEGGNLPQREYIQNRIAAVYHPGAVELNRRQ